MTRERTTLASAALLALVVAVAGCAPPASGPASPAANTNGQVSGQKPAIEVAPAKDEGTWKIVEPGSVTFTVTAPGADSVRLLYRPTIADEAQHVRLAEIKAPAGEGKFTSQVNLPADFAGEVWAEASYGGGSSGKSDEVALRTTYAANGANGESKADPAVSARSDSITKGRIERAALVKGNPNLRITINVPAFQLTLWQDGKEIETYPIAIGRKDFPLEKGNRVARQIIFNPAWVPPDSEWVSEMKGVEPGETYEADDPKNPLGKIKIPLGDAILIHEAKRASELGRLVSHGCARMVEEDLFDLSRKIIDAQGLQVSPQEIEALKTNKERKDVALERPIPVEIAYDTAVVEGGKLHLYPDVYEQKTATAETVRQELQSVGVDPASLDEQAIRQMLEKVDRDSMFVVDVAAIQAGNAVAAGKTEPVVDRGGEGDKKQAGTKSEKPARSSAPRRGR